MLKQNTIEIPRWFERHLHLRGGNMMRTVLPSSLRQWMNGAVVMPNLFKIDANGDLALDHNGKPIPDPVDTVEKAIIYRDQIVELLPEDSDFTPCMTCYLTNHTDPKEVVRGFLEGVWRAVKLYITDLRGQGGTTGSAHGVYDLLGCYPVFEAMEEHNIPLLGHFEAVEESVDEFDREVVSVYRDLEPILKSFPGLPVVFEHLTDGRAAEFVAEYDHIGGLYATVTVHHLMKNRNAMFSGGMNPINYCKPVPKREEHRVKVRQYVTSGSRRFGAGTDSAPHDESSKARCCGCAAGIFSAPMAVQGYATVFDEDGALQHLGPFLSENFLHVYGMEVSSEMMTIVRQPWIVPERVGNVRVFEGGKILPWELVA